MKAGPMPWHHMTCIRGHALLLPTADRCAGPRILPAADNDALQTQHAVVLAGEAARSGGQQKMHGD